VPSSLSELEALLWGLEEHDPRFRAVITVVVGLDRSPGVDHLRARVVRLADAFPRLRQRIVPGATGRLHWAADPTWDPAWHGRVVAAPEPTGLAGVLRLAEPATTEGVDRARSPWHVTLVEGVGTAGEAALVVRLHHVLADGVGAVGLAAVLFDLERGAAEGPPAGTAGSGGGAGGGAPTLDEVAASVRATVETTRRRLPWLAAVAREALADPQPTARSTLDLVRSVARLARPGSGPLSPVMTGRSLASRLDVVDLDLAAAARAGRAAGGTVNDVFVAGLLDGLRRYHAAHGEAPPALRVGVPVNVRDADDVETSNAFAPARIVAPLQVRDAAERIAVVHDLVLRERHQPAHDLVAPLSGVVRRLPGGARALGAAMTGFDALASNVPGPPVPLWLGPARVTALHPFGPRSGAGLNVTLLSYGGRAHIGVHVDPAATPDRKVLVDCLSDGWASTLDSVG
jgi:diacylglycerol O-acyltransferase